MRIAAMVLSLALAGCATEPVMADTVPFLDTTVVDNGLDARDRDALYRTVWAEMRGQTDAEIRNVVRVILVRWKTGRYGSSVYDVVHYCRDDICQFSAWNSFDPQYNKVRAKNVAHRWGYFRVVEICEDVLDTWRGEGPDHYYNGRKPRWARGHKARRIGNTVFLTLLE